MSAIQLNFETAGFEAFLNKPVSKFSIDLSGSNVKNVLLQYELFNRRNHPNYTTSAVRNAISNLEKNFNVEVVPLQIDEDFYSYFFAYMCQQGLKPSSIANYCNILRAALKWGTRHNLQVSPTFDQFKIPSYEKTKVALTPDEVSIIAHFDIKSAFPTAPGGKKSKAIRIETLCRVRDQFILQCNLGQRYSDISRFNPSNFNQDRTKYICVQQKTGNKAVVDINKFAFDKRVVHDLLVKYDYSAPYPHHISNFNKYLREILQRIHGCFDDVIKTENKIRGTIVEEETPKWKAIASYTARRSFATYNINRGFTEIAVRRCTGHKDSRSFCKYVIFGDED